MAQDSDWTPARGWTLACVYSVLWGLGIAIASGGLFVALSPVAPNVPDHWAVNVVTLIVTAALGYPFGHAAAKKVCSGSGLAGKSLVVLVPAALIGAQLAAFKGVSALRGEQPMWILMITLGIGFWSVAAAVRALLTD
ncbi:MAG: hypothetical protein ACE15C_12915 [Phycisphaerae bacterium]